MVRWLVRKWITIVKFGFRLLYNEAAFTYDVVSWVVSLGSWRCWVSSALNYLPPKEEGSVLELAHGTGNLQLALTKVGYSVYGLDLSSAMGQITHKKFQGQRLNAHLVQGKSQQLPFPSRQFSAVVSTFPTDFIVAPETLQECHRVLKDEGVLVIVPNAVLTGKGVLARAVELAYTITGQRGSKLEVEDVRLYFSPNGFDVAVHQAACPHSQVTILVAQKIKVI